MSNQMYCSVIDFGTPEFDEALRLRYDVLRKPLNLDFDAEDIAKEYSEIHIGCYHVSSHELLGVLTFKPINDDVVKMRQVAVTEQLQKSGVGRFLVTASEIYAKSKGYSEIELHARMSAVPFYEKMDYQKKGYIFIEVGIEHQYMYKKL